MSNLVNPHSIRRQRKITLISDERVALAPLKLVGQVKLDFFPLFGGQAAE